MSPFQSKGTKITAKRILMDTSNMYVLKNCSVARTSKIFCSPNKAFENYRLEAQKHKTNYNILAKYHK